MDIKFSSVVQFVMLDRKMIDNVTKLAANWEGKRSELFREIFAAGIKAMLDTIGEDKK